MTEIARVELSAHRQPYRRAIANGRYTYTESRLRFRVRDHPPLY